MCAEVVDTAVAVVASSCRIGRCEGLQEGLVGPGPARASLCASTRLAIYRWHQLYK
jgi:hypothetical protein